ncbi:MAG: glycosyltransferase family 1 protein [Burkholderiales bacterium]|jgi:glycosyltransferase involved in cell wall biosynthesis|nr:glycosyltransferase family 1 protein [Burkholderiales bacterium]
MGASDSPSTRPLALSVVTETFPPEVNGVARTIGTMVDALRGRGHRIELIRPRQGRNDAPASTRHFEEVLKRGMPIPSYRELRLGLPAKRALLARWRARRPDIVHVVTEGPLGWSAVAAARQLGVPVASDFHTNFHTYSRHYGFGPFAGVVAGYLRSLHNRADCTMVPTGELKAELEAAGFQRLEVVGRGIDQRVFAPERRDARIRASWGCRADEPVALYVGRLAPEKGLALFVEAALAARVANPALRVVLVGDGPDAASLRKRHPDFVFAGMRFGSDLAAHYASGDVFVFPSTTETFGNVTTEALASGLAVVAFDYAAARQYIRHGHSGLLARPGDRDAFVAHAQSLAADAVLRERLRSEAAQVGAGLSWPRVIDDLEAVFLRLIARRSDENRTASARFLRTESDHASS